jgi:glycosyltransferase involved in cell wall biosynthesis
VPVKLLFTLPTLSPRRSKFGRVLEICRALDRKRFAPMVSVDHKGRLDPVGRAAFESLGVPVLTLRMSLHPRQAGRSFAEVLRTGPRLKRLGIVLQHSEDYSNSPLELAVARIGGVRRLVVTKTNTSTRGLSWWMRWNMADRVVLQSATEASRLLMSVPALQSKAVVITHGVRTDVFKPLTGGVSGPTSPEWLRLGKLVLVCVAHIVPVKDHLSLLRAVAQSRSRSRVVVPLIGDWVDADSVRSIRAAIESLGITENVFLVGSRGDLAGLLPLADGIVLTSVGETISNAVLEGMSCGLPVVCSDVGGMSEIVRPGVNGWLVERGPYFVEELAEAIDEWAEDEARRKEFGHSSRRIVEHEFSIEEMVRKHIELYDSLVR